MALRPLPEVRLAVLIPWACIVGIASIVGCGLGRGTPVQGRVMIRSIGPLDRGMIVFADARILCRGDIAGDGSYRITSGPSGHRVPPGSYKVHFIATGVPDEKTREMQPQIASRVEHVETTDLVADVPDNPSGVTLDFEVDPPVSRGR